MTVEVRLFSVLASLFAAFLLVPPFALAAEARDPGAAAHWLALTRMDLDAAYALLSENHPAAAAELKDDAFKARLQARRAAAHGLAERADSYDGYVATLASFAAGMGDKHIYSRPLYTLDRIEWPGVIMSRRAGAWIVADEDASDAPPLKGARLVACDGRPADEIARELLGGFRIDWSIEAQRIQAAPWLLVGEGNPFVARPKVCEFEQGGRVRSVTLQWRRTFRSDLMGRLRTASGRGAPGFGVRQVGAGWWISLQSLNDRGAAVAAEVKARAAELRRGAFVVLDMRGNGGGNSAFGREIAEALLGGEHVKARLENGGADACLPVWRASPGNLATMEDYKARFGPRLGPDYVKELDAEIALTKTALAAGRGFGRVVDCGPAPAAPDRPAPAPLFTGRLILLTDNVCFSSCLLVTDDFRRLGALHLGQSTDAATRYFEVRETLLPSGLSMFSTLQAVSLAAPLQIGPFDPELAYPDDIADTAALEKWVVDIAARSTG